MLSAYNFFRKKYYLSLSPSVIAVPLWIQFKTTCLKHQNWIVKICINTFHNFFPLVHRLLLSYFYIVSHYIYLLSYPSWRVNNIHSLSLHSLFCLLVQNTNSFFVGATTEALWILFAATSSRLKFSTNNNNVGWYNISYRLIYSGSFDTRSSTHCFYSAHLNQEPNIMKDLQWDTLFTLTVQRLNAIICLQSETVWLA